MLPTWPLCFNTSLSIQVINSQIDHSAKYNAFFFSICINICVKGYHLILAFSTLPVAKTSFSFSFSL